MLVVWVTMGQTWDWLPDCQGIPTLHLRRKISSNQGTIHASISEPTSWYLAYNHPPNVSSFISNKTEHHLLTGWPYNLVNMFTTESYGPPSDTINCPVALIFTLPESMSLSVSYSPPNCQELWRIWALLYRGSMDACSRCEAPLSESKNFITHGTETSMKVSIHYAESPSPSFHKEVQMIPAGAVGCTPGDELRTWEPKSFIVGRKHTCLCPGGRHYLYYPRQ